MTSRARRWGFRQADLQDAQQQIALELLHFEYDPHNPAGASEVTAVTALIDRQLAMFRRSEGRHRRRVDRLLAESPTLTYDPVPASDRSLDVREVVGSLSPVRQQICAALADGLSVHQVARQLHMSWHTVRRHIASIRGHLEQVGLGEVATTVGREAAAA